MNDGEYKFEAKMRFFMYVKHPDMDQQGNTTTDIIEGFFRSEYFANIQWSIYLKICVTQGNQFGYKFGLQNIAYTAISSEIWYQFCLYTSDNKKKHFKMLQPNI